MPTSFTETEVANMSLDLLREAPISDLSDTSKAVARLLNRNFANARDTVLEAHPWRFALDRELLTKDVTAPAFGWDYRFQLPSTCLRPLPLREDGLFEGPPILHEIEGDYILTNNNGPLKFRFVGRRDTPGTWSNLYCSALQGKLAWRMAHWLTGKQSYIETARQHYFAMIDEARRVDAMMGSPERADQSEVVSIRYT